MSQSIPRVSVIVASYNHASYIKAAIQSVLNQTWQDFEIIITDDGSVDETPSLVLELKDPRINLSVFDENRGACIAMNACISRARGEYIAVLNSDDLFAPDKLERQVAYLDQNPTIGGVFSWPSLIDERGKEFLDESHKDYLVFDVQNRSRADWLHHFFYHGNCLCHPTLMIRRACYDRIGCYDERLAQVPDLDFWIRLCSECDIHVVTERLTFFRIRDHLQNASAARIDVQIRDLWERQKLYFHYLSLNEGLFKEVFCKDIDRLGINGVSLPIKLALLAIDAGSPHHQAFALDLLFNVLGDKKNGRNELAASEFIRLTAACDLRGLRDRDQYLKDIKDMRCAAERDAATIMDMYFNIKQKAKENLDLKSEYHRQISVNSELELALRGLQNYSHEQQLEIEKLSQLRLEHLQEIANLSGFINAREKELTVIHSSRSWRLVSLLRAMKAVVGSRRKQVLIRFAKNLLISFRGELRRQGLIALTRRIPYYFRNYRVYVQLLASRPPAADGGLFNAVPPVSNNNVRLHPDLININERICVSVSVVIPTLNAGFEFGWLLRKLQAQAGLGEIEVVIVDSGSTDGTVEIARAAGCLVVQISPEQFSHSYARNVGAEAARGDYLLFMVQDAYPIGDFWLYGILRYLLDHEDERLVAASCAEYSRSDSDMMYDSMINTHYRFLGCLDYDRIGEYQGDDHMSLRSLGQLSDVSCLIKRTLFSQYRYRGDYAEDLDLGIRLIRDGYRVAMLASVKVIHSHNRSAYYYLKRSFVDVIFLVNLFDDFIFPHVESFKGLVIGIVSTAGHLTECLAGFDVYASSTPLSDDLWGQIQNWRRGFVVLSTKRRSMLGDARLDDYINHLADRYLEGEGKIVGDEQYEARRFLDAFLARLEHFNAFAINIYGAQDATVREGLRNVICKTFAATVGSALGFMYMDQARGGEGISAMAEEIKSELQAGI